MIKFTKDPWFNLGIHVDHKAPYIAIHLPGFRIEFGRTPSCCYSISGEKDIWVLTLRKPTKEERGSIKQVLRELNWR